MIFNGPSIRIGKCSDSLVCHFLFVSNCILAITSAKEVMFSSVSYLFVCLSVC